MLEKGGEEDGVEGPLRPSELTHLLKCSSQPKPSLLPPRAAAEQAMGRVVKMIVGRERNFPLTATTIETAPGKDTTLCLPSAFTPVISGFQRCRLNPGI